MDARIQKQLLIGGVYVIIFGLIGFWFYSANFAPSCHDGKQNGQETGIDCGIAACGVACPVPVQALQIQSIQAVRTPAGDYDAAIQIYNPNTAYGVMSGTYDLVLTDAAGTEVARKAGNQFYMLPGQTKYLVLTALAGVPDGATPSVAIKGIQWEKVSGDSSVSLTATNVQMIPKGSQTSLTVLVVNGSDYDFDTVDVAVAVFDGSGKLVTTNTTNLQTVVSGSQRAINVAWPFAIPAGGRVSVEVGTNVFNNNNFLKQHGTQEQFQQYF